MGSLPSGWSALLRLGAPVGGLVGRTDRPDSHHPRRLIAPWTRTEREGEKTGEWELETGGQKGSIASLRPKSRLFCALGTEDTRTRTRGHAEKHVLMRTHTDRLTYNKQNTREDT